MATNMYLQLAGMDGESQTEGFQGWIQVDNCSFGGSQITSVAGSNGSGAGKVSLTSISVTKKPDKSSTQLFLMMCTGKLIATGTLSAAKAGSPEAYLTVSLKELYVDSFQTNYAGEDPTEQVQLSYKQIEYSYSAQNQRGDLVSTGSVGWDISSNTRL